MNDKLTIILHLTNRCNLKCSYCWTNFDENREYQEMSAETWKSIKYTLQKYSSQRDIHILIEGGEPTLHKDLKKICYELSSYPLMVISNGINQENILDLPTFVKIRLSYHKGYNYNRFINFILQLKKTHYVEVVCPIDVSILQDCINLMNFCNEHNIIYEPQPIVSNNTRKQIDYNICIEELFHSDIKYYSKYHKDFFNKPLTTIECFTKVSTNQQKKSICMIPHFEIEADGSVIPSCGARFSLMRHITDKDVFAPLYICNDTSCLSKRGVCDLSGWRV